MQDVREVIREKGVWEGMLKGRQEVVLNMLKKNQTFLLLLKLQGFLSQ